jgi:cathepsin B
METGFQVWEDFTHYKGGIYQYEYGTWLGGHAVKIIGWGVEGGINYWIVANSWGSSWGENGFFRIAFGQCGIDDLLVVSCKPDIRKSNVFEALL